jgi:hypothetical protein
MDFSLLINNKNILNILNGDVNVFENYSLPYLSGPQLCDLSTQFGLARSYGMGGGNPSRWVYMQDLLQYLNKQDRVGELLSCLLKMERFDQLTGLGDVEKIKTTYKAIVEGAIKNINCHLLIARKEIRIIHNQFVIVTIGEEVKFDAPKVKVVTSQYIQELSERIKDDIENKDYDSVITKSRTLLEEVLIYIIEKMTFERYKSNGDLVKIYQDATELLGMRQKSEWDKRVNEMLGGLHKLVSAISSMRNMNSDAHGAGSGRINIRKREALLVANSSMMLAEYWLSVFEKKE